MHACMHKKEGRLENKKFFELKNEGYRDGIKRRQDRDGIAHLKLHCVKGP